jgi:hypothetical protein
MEIERRREERRGEEKKGIVLGGKSMLWKERW